MKKMTEANLKDAFAGESQAHMKYNLFGDVAEKEGFPHVARLFRAIAYAEQVHAMNHARSLGLINKTTDNLQAAMDGENFEVDEMYPAYDAVAKLQNENKALKSIFYALEAEKIHAEMYQEARKRVSRKNDWKIGDIHVCDICGHTVIGEPPDICPVCKAKKNRYRKF